MSATKPPTPAAITAAAMAATATMFRERADEALRGIWCEMRNDASPAAHRAALACIGFARAVELLTREQGELWERRLSTCPGHDDEGGRDWCAYCGEMPKEET